MATDASTVAVRARYWLTDRIPTLIALGVFVVIWQGLAMFIDNNRIVAYPGYTWRSLVANADTVSVRIVETFTSVAVAFLLAGFTGRGQSMLETHPWKRGAVAGRSTGVVSSDLAGEIAMSMTGSLASWF